MDNLEMIIGILLGVGLLCIMVLFGGGLLLLFSLRNRKLRQAAQSWKSTTGRVLEARSVPRVNFQLGITEAEAQARIKKIEEDGRVKPRDVLAIALSAFGPAGELAGDLLSPEPTNVGVALEKFPMIVYEYEVNGVKYLSNRVRVQDQSGPTTGGSIYEKQLFQRYPKGASVTVYYDPQNPRESALER